MEPADPYLSVIVTSRNDDHGGTLLRRMQAFTNCLLAQCRRHGLSAELIVVEWNPPADRPPLAHALRWPDRPWPCSVRFIQVPPALHARYPHAAALPLFQMIAKNVGLRRARGRYLLATNIDILFSDELCRFLARRELRPGLMYRIDRLDVAGDVPVDAPVPEQLAYCRAHHLRNNALLGTIRLTPGGEPDYAPVVQAAGVALGDGWCGLTIGEGVEPHTWGTPGAELRVRAPDTGDAVLGLDLRPGPSLGWRAFTLVVRDGSGREVARGRTNGHRVLLQLPLVQGQTHVFRLDAEEPPVPADREPRTLLFCLYHCGWEPAMRGDGIVVPDGAVRFATRVIGHLEPDDVVGQEAGVRFSRNWFEVSRTVEGTHRWAPHDTFLVIEPPTGPHRVLVLDLQPTPGKGGEPFVLQVFDPADRLVARARVSERQAVALALPLPAAGPPQAYRLQALGGVPPAEGVFSPAYRLFGCRWRRDLPPLPPQARPEEFRSASARHSGFLWRDDVAAPDGGVRFGPSWSGVGRAEEGKHRWAGPGALLLVEPPGPERVLVLDVQPGPGVGWEPFDLQVFDAANRVVARARVTDRQAVALALPQPPAEEPAAYRLHATGGGRPAANGHVLDFRLFGCHWRPALPPLPAGVRPGEFHNASTEYRGSLVRDDVAAPDAGVRFGRHWFGVSRDRDGAYRWGGPDAVLVVEAGAGRGRALALDVQPGPGVGGRPFVLQVFDEADQLLDQAPVVHRHEVTLLLPPGPSGAPRAYRLRAVGGGRPLPGGGDVLDFRLFGCRWREAGGARVRMGRAARQLGRLLGAWFLDKLARAAGRALWRHVSSVPDRLRHVGNVPPQAEAAPVPAPPPVRGRHTPPLLHTIACGDFTLMAREHWFDLRGYPEWPIFSLHLDSLLCYAAHYAGLREVILQPPLRAYHIEHSIGTGATPESMDLLLKRVRAKGLPCLDHQDVIDWSAAMAAADQSTIFNDEDWGLADEALPETVLRGTEAAGPEAAAA
jgi:hypothetical protein